MRKNLFLLALGILTMLSACHKDDNETPVNTGEVTISSNTLSIPVGKKKTLTATIDARNVSEEEVIWTSSKEEVATVNEAGVVTAKKEGTATITATSVANPTKTATCLVTVIPPVTYAVGEYYPDAVAPVGIVFYINTYGDYYDAVNKRNTNGKIVSLDEVKDKNFGDAKAWASAKKDGDLGWARPLNAQLQYLWCAYNGKPQTLWNDKGELPDELAADETAQKAFNKKLTDAKGIAISGGYYWGAEMSVGNTAYYMSFATAEIKREDNNTGDLHNIRAIADF